MNRGLAWFALIGVLVTCPLVHGEDKTELAKRLHRASEMSSLDDPALKPWHLKLDVQLYNNKGNPFETGTIEEWWTPTKDKRIYTTPSYTATEIRDQKSIYRSKATGNVPYLLDTAWRRVVHPILPLEVIDTSDLEMKVVSFGKAKLDCVMLSKPGRSSGDSVVGMVQTYCLNQGSDELRASWLDPQIDTVDGTGNFQGRRVEVAGSVAIARAKALSERVEVLTSFTPDDALFVHGDDVEDQSAGPVWLDPGTMRHTAIKTVPPKYPEEAKRRHIFGTILLEVVPGKDGHTETMKAVGYADPDLLRASTDAVKQWIYKPSLVDGVATAVQTRIAIHFNFSGG